MLRRRPRPCRPASATAGPRPCLGCRGEACLDQAAHPSGLAIAQTRTARPTQVQVGGNFFPELLEQAVDGGVFTTMILLIEIDHDLPQSEGWTAQRRGVLDAFAAWRARGR